MSHPLTDITGEKFNRWLVIERVDNRGKTPYWLCECECGTLKEVRGSHLRHGKSKSCGCLLDDFNKTQGTHRMTKSREYICWRGMKSRCKKDPHYLERGIKVHPLFEKFENFYEYMGEKPTPEHTIDRIDGTRGYEPGNVRWVTMKENLENRSW